MAIDLLSLAPRTLRNNRPRRYLGDTLALPISAFVAADEKRIRAIYDFVLELYSLFNREALCDDRTIERLRVTASKARVHQLVAEARHFGFESAPSNPTELFAKIVHDLRGGGLTLLLGHLQLALIEGWSHEAARTIFFLTRDHLKIMRNALPGLDDARRADDQRPKRHSIQLIVEKWQDALLIHDRGQAHLHLESTFDGDISESCLEFGALDRILYNLLNNACRHTADEVIRLFLLPVTEENLRFVLANRLTEKRLQASFRERPHPTLSPKLLDD